MANTVTRSIIVRASVEDAYQAWSMFENFPHFMKHVESVHKTGAGKSHWEVKGPLGSTVEWVAETTTMEANKRIGWNTKDDAGDVTTSGQVTFNPLADDQTEVTVTMNYDPKGGLAGEIVAKLFANPEEKLDEDLNNFKAYIEGQTHSASRM
jgi:uncharacterized membrane protein